MHYQLRNLLKIGPLGLLWKINNKFVQKFSKIELLKIVSSRIKLYLLWVQYNFDKKFDTKYKTDTTGIIPIKDLKIKSKNTDLAIWYEPMSSKIFHRIFRKLSYKFKDFYFVDFGSGKGRVILMASSYNFKKLIGVEFAEDLHEIAKKNIEIFNKSRFQLNEIETICEDATDFLIPEQPSILFFFSPFKSEVLKRVISNINNSYLKNKRKIVIIFYGKNLESIELFDSLKFHKNEIFISADWTRINNYRSIIYESPNEK